MFQQIIHLLLLESLINSKTEQYNISIAKQTEETKNTIKETKKRITAYQAEINAIQRKNNVNLILDFFCCFGYSV